MAADRSAAPIPARAYLVLAVSVAAISWAAPLIRFTDAHPMAITFWRLILSLPLIAMIIGLRGEWSQVAAVTGRQGRAAAMAGALLALHFVLWIASVQFTKVAASVALVATQPVWVAIIGYYALRERPNRRQWIGIGVAMLGAVVIGFGDWRGGSQPFFGDMLALGGAIAVSFYYVIGRKLRLNLGIWPYVLLVYGMATIVVLVFALVARVPLIEGYQTQDWLVFAALAAGPMLLGHTGQNYALGYMPAYLVNISLLGEPIGATLIAWLLPQIAEVPSGAAVLGGTLILSGILAGMIPRRRQ